MDEKNQVLWERLTTYQVDTQDAVFPFSKRLARENGWSDDYVRRVIEEYKRFLFLAITTDHPVCPSKIVDKAWHLHLTYTRSYWNDLCEQVLEHPLHHEPTRGGCEEYDKYSAWYDQTIFSYEKTFGEKPPTDIWPTPSSQFQSKSHLDSPSFLQPLFSSPQRTLVTASLVLSLLFITIIFMSLATVLGHWPSFYELWSTPWHFLIQLIQDDPAYAVLVALAGGWVVWVLRSAWKTWKTQPRKSGGGSLCGPSMCGGCGGGCGAG